MIWEALLYTLGTGAGAYLVHVSRRSACDRGWDAFWLGWGLISWGAGHLLGFIPMAWVRIISLSLCVCFSLFFLLALHTMFAPYLGRERWKTLLDALTLCAMLGTTAVCLMLMPDLSRQLHAQMALQSGFLLLLPAVTLALANRRMADAAQPDRRRLLAAVLPFIVLTAALPFLSPALLFGAGAASLWLLCRAHQRRERVSERSLEIDDCTHSYERLTFSLHDASMAAVLLTGTVVAALSVAAIPRLSLIGMALGALVALVRLVLTIRANRSVIKRAFGYVDRLERRFAEQLEQSGRKNAQMAQLLKLKQRYEQLLIVSNEHSMREVSYENLQLVIEELVDAWFAKMGTLLYLRLSLESADGVVYYESVRGNPDHPQIRHTLTEQIVVDEQRDSPLSPRYVVVLAKTADEEADEKEMEHPFYRLLAVNVRGLILRCLHENQSLELRLMEQEMELARRIQLLLIPEERMVLPRLQAKAVYLPVAYVGGDYVDYVRIDQRYTCFVVADASGHGLPASLMANSIRSALRAVIQTCWEPDQILYRLNNLLYADLSKTRSFITMLIVVYDAVAHKLFLSRAGHPQPLYLSASKVGLFSCAGGLGLGLSSDSRYVREEMDITEDGMLLVYTDGLPDLKRRDSSRCPDRWRRELSALWNECRTSAEDRIALVEQRVWELTRAWQQKDDISLLILQFQTAAKKEGEGA
ncbi:SpoIIE family protein phosphatase [Brevibacillus sedimenti]|jgi:serine phosphatase RsbU (regulator of sigma subunit)|uniref:SpoIIE family protein phosphatase n=1 Tax=Brevibacillus sedimenti TaxID=2613334 RepID=UPI001E64ED2B|nr:SpoIIE family protein phosphatase [Anoxybacillus sediminis]